MKSARRQTRLGMVRGIEREGVERYLGLPYAAPPIGHLRWREPQPAEPWRGTFDASQFPNRCLQAPAPDVLHDRATPGEMSEDCLYLNIYTPAGEGAGRPVMFWIHGGAFILGSANSYDGTMLARDHDVVVVALNYRLGIFGFQNIAGLAEVYQGSGNRGLQDQVAALRWVHDNIADYGGDTNNVTIFGESAGGTSVLTMHAIPSARGLFHRSICFSGTDVNVGPIDGIAPLHEHFELEGDDLLAAALAASPNELLEIQQKIGGSASPQVDGVVVTETATQALMACGAIGPPLIAGCNKDEGTMFSSYNKEAGIDAAMVESMLPMFSALVNLDHPADYETWVKTALSDVAVGKQMERWWYDVFRAAALRNAAAAHRAGAGGWVFNFNVPTDDPLGVAHGSEIVFTFNTFADDRATGLFTHDKSVTNEELARLWSSMMVQFARTGNPNGPDLPEWPQYGDDAACLIFDDAPHVVHDPDGAEVRAAYGI